MKKYKRPKTRGELVECLNNGIECEVVSDGVEATCMLIDGWLNPPKYTIKQSHNQGWSVFTANQRSEK